MTDLSDLRRRAAQHAGYGNEWARKAVGLVDRLLEAERQRDEAAELFRRLAEARREYADNAGSEIVLAELRGESTGLQAAGDLLAGELRWDDAVAHFAPSWRWPEFGAHNPLPDTNPATGAEST